MAAKQPVFSRVDPSIVRDLERLAKQDDRSNRIYVARGIRAGVAAIEQKRRQTAASA